MNRQKHINQHIMRSYNNDFLQMNQEEFNESWLSRYDKLIRSGIWHLTSIVGIKGIQHSGYIEPNLGNRNYTYPQSNNSYGKLKKYVCLFDFYSVDDNEFVVERRESRRNKTSRAR